MGFFFRKKDIKSIYAKHFLICQKLIKNSSIDYDSTIQFELAALLYVITDYAVASSGQNRERTSSSILDYLFSENIITNVTSSVFRDRLAFYGSVIRGMDLHAHCLPGVDISNAHPVICCVIAFTDCLLFSEYMYNYNSPAPFFSVLETFEISCNILEPLNTQCISIFNDICG